MQNATNITTAPELFAEYPCEVLSRFKAWYKANPWVFQAFKAKAVELRDAGNVEYGARAICEVIRWEKNKAKKVGDESFIINCDFIPLMSRLLIWKDPSFAEFFSLRAVRSRGIKSQEQRARELVQ